MPDPLHSRIQQQYASERGRPFYRTVMGDGGFDIHYGHYADETTSMQRATLAATERLLELATERKQSAEFKRILDLGSGRGGPAHYLAKACHCQVTCVDLCSEHHDENLRQAEANGIGNKIETWLGSFESLPAEWEERFELVWGQESFCHATDSEQVIREAYRASCDGGVIAFSDIMISNVASESDAVVFSDVNAIMRLTTADSYQQVLERVGYTDVRFEDWTHHLAENFRRMLQQIRVHREELNRSGVDQPYLDDFANSLEARIRWTKGSVLQWGAFTAVRRTS